MGMLRDYIATALRFAMLTFSLRTVENGSSKQIGEYGFIGRYRSAIAIIQLITATSSSISLCIQSVPKSWSNLDAVD